MTSQTPDGIVGAVVQRVRTESRAQHVAVLIPVLPHCRHRARERSLPCSSVHASHLQCPSM